MSTLSQNTDAADIWELVIISHLKDRMISEESASSLTLPHFFSNSAVHMLNFSEVFSVLLHRAYS